MIDLLERRGVTDAELERVVKLFGNQAVIRHNSNFDPNSTEKAFSLSLRKIIETGSSESDPFAFMQAKRTLAQTRALLTQIEQNPRALIEAVVDRISMYTPQGLKMEVTIHFVNAGTSDGFAADSHNFFVALRYFGDDYEGLKLLMAHELYHNAQAAIRDAGHTDSSSVENATTRALNLLESTMDEGTASLVGDPLEIQNGKAYIEWFQGKFRRNLNHLEMNFALLDTLLYRAYNDADASASSRYLYNMGFSGIWESPLYFVGYRMAKVIEKYKGRGAIAGAIGKSPVKFFADYIEIYRRERDPQIIKFSKSTEEIVRRLQEAENRR